MRENSAPKLAEAIGRLLDDPQTRDKMGRLGAERIQTLLNWEKSVEQLLQAYAAVLNSREK